MKHFNTLLLLLLCLGLATVTRAGTAEERADDLNATESSMDFREGFFRVVGPNGEIINNNLKNGERINREKWPRFTIEYVIDPTGIGSVVLELDGPRTKRQVENGAPYFLFGDNLNTGQIFTRTFPAGFYSIGATLYARPKAKDKISQTHTVEFEVYQPTKVSAFNLWNNLGDPVAAPMEDGYVLMLGEVSGDKFNIQVVTDPEFVGSVEITLAGPLGVTNLENNHPYFLFGNRLATGEKFARALPPGEYTLTAQPFEKSGATGWPGIPSTISFTVMAPMPGFADLENSNLGSLENDLTKVQLADQRSVKVFPNPTSGPFVLDLPDVQAGETLQLWLSDQMGQSYDLTPFVRNGAQQLSLDRGALGLPQGIYFLNARTENRSFPSVQLMIMD